MKKHKLIILIAVLGVFIVGGLVLSQGGVQFGAKPLVIGDKVRYVGDLIQPFNKVGWIVDVQPKNFRGVYDNPEPYMVAFLEDFDGSEMGTKWRTRFADNPELYPKGYAYSHPFPHTLPDELRWDFENRIWASESQLVKIATAKSRNIKKGLETIMTVELENEDASELLEMEKALIPPNEKNKYDVGVETISYYPKYLFSKIEKIKINLPSLFKSAIATLVDNLDTCDDGPLDTNAGCPNWSGDDDECLVSAANALNSSTKGVKCIDPGAPNLLVSKAFVAEASGNQIAYISADQQDGNTYILLTESSTIRIQFGFRTDGDIRYFDGSIYQQLLATYATNPTEYKIEVQYQTSDDTAKYQINDGGFGAFDSTNSGWTTLDGLGLNVAAGATDTFWYDEFSDPNAPAAAPTEIPTDSLIIYPDL